jgi:hypothetical protein
MNKTVGIVVLLFLLLIGAGAFWTLNDPASARKLMGLDTQQPPTKTVAQQTVPTPSEQPSEITLPAPILSPDNAPPEKFDRKASTKPIKPPSREEFEKQRLDQPAALEISRKGRYVGPRKENGTINPPPPELYPMEINRRTYPDANSITIEFAIKNASGVHWKSAYISLRAPLRKQEELFEISDWKIDEVVGLDYTFAKNETELRLKGMRVVSVDGDVRQSALARRIEEDRLKALNSNTEETRPRPRQGDALTAPGLLGLMGQFQQPFSGITVIPTKFKAPEKQLIPVELPPDQLLSQEMDFDLRETSDERHEVRELLDIYHQDALAVQSKIIELSELLKTTPYQDLMKSQGNELVTEIQGKLSNFNKSGHNLGLRIAHSNDDEVQRTSKVLLDIASHINAQIETVETAVKAYDSSFQLQDFTL